MKGLLFLLDSLPEIQKKAKVPYWQASIVEWNYSVEQGIAQSSLGQASRHRQWLELYKDSKDWWRGAPMTLENYHKIIKKSGVGKTL